MVVIEVVLGEIAEDRSRKPTTGHPLLIEGMGAHLHRRELATSGRRLRQLGLQAIGHRGGVGGRDAVPRPAVHQCSEQGRRRPGGAGQVFDQMGHGRFAVGARHTDQPHPLAGAVPIGSRQLPQGLGHRFFHHHNRIARIRRVRLGGLGADDRGSGPRLQCLAPETATIHLNPGKPQEQRLRGNGTGIAGDAAQRHVGQSSRHHQAHIAQQGMQRVDHRTPREEARSNPRSRGWTAPVATS